MAFVLVETISQYRMRYVVEVPDSSKVEWALDTVTMEEAKEFSQHWLGETIFSHRLIDEKDATALYRKDNDYLSQCSDEKIKEQAFTKIKKLHEVIND